MRPRAFLNFLAKHRLLIYSFGVSFVILAICSKSSFLYPFNDWVDANCFSRWARV